jgi:hypothetical protein
MVFLIKENHSTQKKLKEVDDEEIFKFDGLFACAPFYAGIRLRK